MHLANARRPKIEDSIDGEIPSTSGAQLSEDNFADLSNAKVSKVVPVTQMQIGGLLKCFFFNVDSNY